MNTTVDRLVGAEEGTRRLRVAGGVALVAALCLGAAPLVGVVSPEVPPAYPSWPVLVLCGALCPALAVFHLRGRRPAAARAVLLATGAVAVGGLFDGVQLLLDPALAPTPELFLPRSLRPLDPGLGTWAYLLGWVGFLVAGALAAPSGPVSGTNSESGAPVAGQRLFTGVLCASALAAVGSLLARFTSEDPFVFTEVGPGAAPAVFTGEVLLALSVPLVAGSVVSSADPHTARAGLLGLAGALTARSVPVLAAALVHPELAVGWGTLAQLLAVFAFLAMALLAGRTGTSPTGSGELSLPAPRRLTRLTGVVASSAGVLALLAALLPQLRTPDGSAGLGEYTDPRVLLVAGCVFALLGLSVLSARGTVLRPAVTVAWAVIPLGGAASLDIVLHVAGATPADLMPLGVWLTVAALPLSGAAAVCAGMAGGAERDEVDLSELRPNRPLLAVVLPLAGLATAAFVLPVLRAPDYVPLGVFGEFGIASWGLLAALLVVLAGLVPVPFSRRPRAAALLVGSALVLGVRLAQAPLTAPGIPGAVPGPGLWCAAAGLVLAVLGAVVAGRPRR